MSKIFNHRFFKTQTVAEATIFITLLLFLGKIIAYLKQVLVANYFGASLKTDAFLIALIIPTFFTGLISDGLSQLIIPVYIQKKKKSPQKAKLFINQIFFIWLVIVVILSFVLLFCAPLFVRIFAFGFTGERLSLTITLTRYLIPLGFTTLFISFFKGVLQAHKQFLYPRITDIIGGIILILSLVFFTRYLDINSWVIGQLSYGIFGFFALFWLLRKSYKFFRKLCLKNMQWLEIRCFIWLLIPAILSGGVGRLNQLVDKTIASSLPIGSVAILNFANSIFYIPAILLVVPLATAVYPTFSTLALDRNKKKEYAHTIQKTLSLVWYLIIPASIILIILSKPIVVFLFQRGAFSEEAANITALTVSMYSVGLIAYAANYFLMHIFYSFKNTRAPLILSVTIVAINIIGTIALSRFFGAPGIALATALSLFAGSIVYFAMLRRYFEPGSFKGFWRRTIKILLAAIPIFLTSILIKPYITSSSGFLNLLIKLTLSGSLFALLYYCSSKLLKIEECNIITHYAKTQSTRLKIFFVNKK